jgi:hypothetical protein
MTVLICFNSNEYIKIYQKVNVNKVLLLRARWTSLGFLFGGDFLPKR